MGRASRLATAAGLTAGGAAVARLAERRRVEQLWREIESLPAAGVLSEASLRDLPPAARRYLSHTLAPGTSLVAQATLVMSGGLRLGRRGPWAPFRATEAIAPRLGFVWRVAIAGVLRGADTYAHGDGRVRAAILAVVPLVRAGGPQVSRAAFGRLVAESVLVPTALLPGPGVEWIDLGSDTAAGVAIGVDGWSATLTLRVDADGRLEEAVVDRWKADEGRLVPFGVRVHEERRFGDVMIPSRVSAGWGYGTGDYVETFRATISDATFGPTAAASAPAS